jgi:hypothetical protein
VAIDPTTPRSRRSLLAGALGGAGLLVANALGKANPVAAANGDPVLLGQGTTATQNAATAPTVVNATGANAVVGLSTTAIGVFGRSTGPGTGRSTGVVGATGNGSGIADDIDQTGVYGFADDSVEAAGVWGDTSQGTGVVGTGDWGVYGSGFVGVVGNADAASNGVYGFAGDEEILAPIAPAGVLGIAGVGAPTGVRGHAAAGATYGMVASASSMSQTALYVAGKLKLYKSGRVAIGSTATTKSVSMAGVTTSSYVIATLQTVATSGCYIRAVVPGTNTFTIYLSRTPGKTVYVGYVVVN